MPRKMTAKEVSDKLNDDTLDLGLCDLEEVPVKEIFTIKRYLTVDLSSNLLVTLPKNFAILTQIVKLDLSNNLLESLPENFGELKMLKHLDLYHNKISRLPLSLGDLKNLKWLDLKDNPLTPAVASIAGPCINSNECYACAKNIVTYLSKVKITIEEEKERRLKAKQEIEKTEANNKKEAKKKKNAQNKNNVEKEKATPILKIEPSEQSNMQKPPKVNKTNQHSKKKKQSNGGAFNLVCRVFTSLIIWSVFFVFLTAVVIAILPLYDKQQSEEVFRYIEIQAGVPIKYYRQEGIKLLEVSIEKAKLWSNQAREVAEKTYQEYFPEDVATKKKSES